MSQHEFLCILNNKMLQAVKYRKRICVDGHPEEHGQWHGKYLAYEEIIQMLMIVDISPTCMTAPMVSPTG